MLVNALTTLTKGSVLKSINVTSVSVKQRGFADDFIIKRLCQFTHIEDRRNVRSCKLCSFFGRPGSSTKFMCFFPQRTHLFSGSNTVPMLIWCFKHAWFRIFRSINPATTGVCRVSFVDGPDLLLRLLLFKELLNSAIFKFNSTNARILLLYPYIVNNNVVGGTNRTDESSSFWQAWCTYRKREN